MKKFYFKTPYQARQAISHGHIIIGDRVVNVPSYVVKVEEEDKVKLTPESIFNKILSKPEPESELGSPETENIEIKEVGTVEKISTDEKPATEEKPSTE
jgi:small subunit ribosomal protein S4